MSLGKKKMLHQAADLGVGASFNTVTYTGNGSTQSISTVGFQPDLVWVKNRNTAGNPHELADSVRGVNNTMGTNAPNAEYNDTTYQFNSFDANGFTVTDDTAGNYAVNGNNETYVAWCWKAGGAAVSNTDGTVTAQVSANVDSGFSISTYTGVGYPNSTTATVGHGLNSAPELVIIKKRDSTGFGNGSWIVGTEYAGSGWDGSMYLNSTGAYYNAINYFFNGDPTGSVVKLKNDWFINGNNNNYVMYCFHSVDGYQKVGSYTGDNPNTVTVDLGFVPRFIMTKAYANYPSAAYWHIVDTTRDSSLDAILYPNATDAEASISSNTTFMQPLSIANGDSVDGFSTTGANSSFNYSGASYLYLAIA